MIPQIAPIDSKARQRRTPESVWPLRGADGRTFAEAKDKREKEEVR